jgi:hypothetical protein
MKKPKKIDLENLNLEEIKKIKSMAGLGELNIFFDRNKIIVALCRRLIKLLKK